MADIEIDDDPLDYGVGTTSFPLISEEMLSSMALGMEDEVIIAARHGLSVEDFQKLEAQPHIQARIAVLRSEFEKNGVTFKAKAAWMASDLLEKVYVQAASADASLSQRHDVLKTLIKAGGLEPKEEKLNNSGPGFSISIDLGGGNTLSLSNMNDTNRLQTLDLPTKIISDES